MLVRALAEFGDLGGIVKNIRTDQLVGGHQRVEAFRNSDDVQVTVEERLNKPDKTGTVAFGYVHVNGTKYSYREVDWEVEKETAANLAANKMGGEFVFDQVATLINELDGKMDLALTGFSNTEILALMEGLNQPLGLEDMVAPSDAINFVIRCENMAEMNEVQQRIGLDGFRTDAQVFLKKLDEMTRAVPS